MADIRIRIDRTNPEQRNVVISALPGTDAATYEMAKPRIQKVLEAIGASVVFEPLSEIEQHTHAEQTLVVNQTQMRT